MKTKKPTPTYSRQVVIEPLTAEAFPNDKNSRETKEATFLFEKIMGVVMGGHNSVFSIADVYSVASSLPISLSVASSMFSAWTEKAIEDKRIKQVPALFPDERLYEKLC